MITYRTITITDYHFIDGALTCVGTKSKTKTFKKQDPKPMTIEDYWLKDAPISYQEMEVEMARTGVIDDNDKTWLLIYDKAPDRYLRAFYNMFKSARCLPFLNARELKDAFNNSYNTKLKHSRGLNGEDLSQDQEQELKSRLSRFASIFRETNRKETSR